MKSFPDEWVGPGVPVLVVIPVVVGVDPGSVCGPVIGCGVVVVWVTAGEVFRVLEVLLCLLSVVR